MLRSHRPRGHFSKVSSTVTGDRVFNGSALAPTDAEIWSKLLIYESRGADQNRRAPTFSPLPFQVAQRVQLLLSCTVSAPAKAPKGSRAEENEKLFTFQLIIFHFLLLSGLAFPSGKLRNCVQWMENLFRPRKVDGGVTKRNFFRTFFTERMIFWCWSSQIIKQVVEVWTLWVLFWKVFENFVEITKKFAFMSDLLRINSKDFYKMWIS